MLFVFTVSSIFTVSVISVPSGNVQVNSSAEFFVTVPISVIVPKLSSILIVESSYFTVTSPYAKLLPSKKATTTPIVILFFPLRYLFKAFSIFLIIFSSSPLIFFTLNSTFLYL